MHPFALNDKQIDEVSGAYYEPRPPTYPMPGGMITFGLGEAGGPAPRNPFENILN